MTGVGGGFRSALVGTGERRYSCGGYPKLVHYLDVARRVGRKEKEAEEVC